MYEIYGKWNIKAFIYVAHIYVYKYIIYIINFSAVQEIQVPQFEIYYMVDTSRTIRVIGNIRKSLVRSMNNKKIKKQQQQR